MRPLPAFLFAPLSAILLMLLIGFRMSADADLLSTTLVLLIFVYPLCLFFQLIIAAPLRWFFASRGVRSIWIDGVLGGCGVGLPTAAYAELARVGWASESVKVTNAVAAVAVATILGVAIGLSYGLLRLRDRRAKTRPTATDLAARFD